MNKYLIDILRFFGGGVKEIRPSCFGEPITYHGRAENGCEDCPFERECETNRKESHESHMIETFCSAKEAAKLTMEARERREREISSMVDRLFPTAMKMISDDIIDIAKCGSRCMTVNSTRYTKDVNISIGNMLVDKVVKELTDTLGYRVKRVGSTLEIDWDLDE